MIPDPTDEIRAIRDRLSAACNYELDKIVEETRRHQAESGRTYIDLSSQRKPQVPNGHSMVGSKSMDDQTPTLEKS